MTGRVQWTRGEDLGRSADELVLTIAELGPKSATHVEAAVSYAMTRSDVAEMVAGLAAWLADLPEPKQLAGGHHATYVAEAIP